MEGHLHHQHHNQHHLQQYQLLQQQHHISVNVEASDKFPQWSIQETKEFLMIRAELDPTFMEKKRNKVLWEVISNKMKEKGYNRSAEQCKCKWKNLFTRYKVCMCICITILSKNLRNGEKFRDWIGNICLLICFIE
jgi:hypothetical protein